MDWGYSGEKAPEHWAELSDEYHMCDEGKNQSPIDIAETREADLPELSFDYDTPASRLLRKETAVEVRVPEGNRLKVEGKTFELQQYHFHSPAEHEIDGESYPLELHLVHEAQDGETAVVAVLYEEGEQHSGLYRLLNYLPPGIGEDRNLETADVTPKQLVPENLDYYRYNGSLTTPPCSEGLRWFVLKSTPPVGSSQIDAFKRAVDGPNARPIQPLNARVVLE